MAAVSGRKSMAIPDLREFPENRENNREFCRFSIDLPIFEVNSRSNFSILHTDSLQNLTGNVLRPNREIIIRNTE